MTGNYNFDCPEAYDFGMFSEILKVFTTKLSGRVQMPSRCYISKKKSEFITDENLIIEGLRESLQAPTGGQIIDCSLVKLIVVEGIFVHHPFARMHVNYSSSYYIDIDVDTMFNRRFTRDRARSSKEEG